MSPMSGNLSRRTLLVVHPGAVGDVLLSRQALRALKAGFPGHEVGLLAGGAIGRLLHACGEVDAVFTLESDALTGLLAGKVSLNHPLRAWLRRCELVVCWMDDPDGQLRRTLQDLGVPRVIAHSPACAEGLARHQADRLLNTLGGVVETGSQEAGLCLPPDVQRAGMDRLAAEGLDRRDRIMVLHPGSGSDHKCVAPAVFAGVTSWLQERGMTPVLVIGPADAERGLAVRDGCTMRPVVVEETDLLAMAGVLGQAALFIGHDSGLTHLAAALSVATVALFGPTDPARWAPRGVHVTVVRGEPCRCEGWEAVRACTGKPCLQIQPDDLRAACAPFLRQLRNQGPDLIPGSGRLVLPGQLC